MVTWYRCGGIFRGEAAKTVHGYLRGTIMSVRHGYHRFAFFVDSRGNVCATRAAMLSANAGYR
ncbi:MAG: hypothetical protein KGJ34_03090 [Patescibacteria group bacterium]|nr:hypothetical protein [Patescibacteria group bacterium]